MRFRRRRSRLDKARTERYSLVYNCRRLWINAYKKSRTWRRHGGFLRPGRGPRPCPTEDRKRWKSRAPRVDRDPGIQPPRLHATLPRIRRTSHLPEFPDPLGGQRLRRPDGRLGPTVDPVGPRVAERGEWGLRAGEQV